MFITQTLFMYHFHCSLLTTNLDKKNKYKKYIFSSHSTYVAHICQFETAKISNIKNGWFDIGMPQDGNNFMERQFF
jgi:hypothetical protein